MLQFDRRTYRLHGMTRILGAQAANPKVHSEFIAAKAAKQEKGENRRQCCRRKNWKRKA